METTEKVGEIDTSDEVFEAKPPEEFVEFKKPIFVGKIGRLPRKLVTTEARETPQAVGSSGSQPVGKSPQDSSDNRSNDKIKTLTPALLMKEKSIPLPYKEPKWSGLPPPESGYCLEVLKGGTILETIDLTLKPFYVFGRLCMNDIVMAHPTISRHHAVLQYKARDTEDDRPRGFYLYDMGSSHGTFVNKIRLKASHYARVMVGHMLKLGCSTRQYILQGPEEDKEAESELSLTEMKQLRLARRLEMIKERQAGKPEGKETSNEDDGISWGMGEDAEDETDLSDNPFAVASNEELYLEDPKKTLRGYLEREGCTVEYDCQERGVGQFVCRVELPIEDTRGRPVVAEVIHKGKKKDAVVQCALEACRIIDRHGLLRQAKHESRKRKEKKWTEDDYYDSDEDTFLDRTGSVERKREGRRQKGDTSKALTYTELVEKCTALKKDIAALDARLAVLRAQGRPPEAADKEEEDALDQFMRGLGRQSAADKAEISKTKMEMQKLKLELVKTERLAEIAKPADLPALVVQTSPETSSTPIVKKASTSVIIGKRIKLKNREKTPYKVPKSTASTNNEGEFIEEIDSDEEVTSNDRDKNERISKNSNVLQSEVRLSSESSSEIEDPCSLGVIKGENNKNKDVNVSKGGETKVKGGKTYGPMRPPSNYVVPASYYEQDTDRDLPEITDESGEY